jgi:enoyl-CoA hydratase/carnithine racemase
MAQLQNSPSPGFSTIRFEKSGGLAHILLNRPRQLNAYNVAMRDDLFAALSAVHDDPEVRALILSGAGPAFSTGGDVSEFGTAPSPTVARWVRFRRDVWGRLRALTIPTIAAVHGYAVGGGLEMVLLCDIAIAAEDASFCLPETGLGMIPGVAGTQTAARRLGLGWALDLCITGRWIDAKQALALGLVAEAVPRAALMSSARRLARRMSRLPRERAVIVKAAVWDGLDLRLCDGLAMERRLARRLEKIMLENRAPAVARDSRLRRPGGNGLP